MRQLVTQGIILRRTDYGEADRIITLLTPDMGKLTLMAKGVRRVKSKLAGGIELFSVSAVTYIQGRGDMGTLISARLVQHYGAIVKDIGRTMLGYDLIKQLNRATEDATEAGYFNLLHQAFVALDDPTTDVVIIRLWFAMRLLALSGHMPNLETDMAGKRLEATAQYTFSFEDMTLVAAPPGQSGNLGVDHIKFMRLGFAGHQPKVLGQVRGGHDLAEQLGPLVQTMLQTYIRV